MPVIKLQSADGEIFDTDVNIAKCSGTIKTMLEDLGMDEGEDEVVPLPNVNSAILRKVIQWATYHKDDPVQQDDDENKEKRTDDISSWDADFLKVHFSTLYFISLRFDLGFLRDRKFRKKKKEFFELDTCLFVLIELHFQGNFN
jgi:S-phase kinase-associated protein 1